MSSWQKLHAFIWLLFLVLSIPAEASSKWRVYEDEFEYPPFDDYEPPPAWVTEYDNHHESEVEGAYDEEDASLYREWPLYKDDHWQDSHWSPDHDMEEMDEDVADGDDDFDGLDEFGHSVEEFEELFYRNIPNGPDLDMDFDKMDDFNSNVVPNADPVVENAKATISQGSPDDDIEELDVDVADGDDDFDVLDEFGHSVEEYEELFYRKIPNGLDLDMDFEKMDDFDSNVVPNAVPVVENAKATISQGSPDDDIEELDEDVTDDDDLEGLDEFGKSVEELVVLKMNIPDGLDLNMDFEKMDDFISNVAPNADPVAKNGKATISRGSADDDIEELDEDEADGHDFEILDEFGQSVEELELRKRNIPYGLDIDTDFEQMGDFSENVVPNTNPVVENDEDDIAELGEDITDEVDDFKGLDEFEQSVEELELLKRNIPDGLHLDMDFENMDDFNNNMLPNADAEGNNGEATIEILEEETSFGTEIDYRESDEDLDLLEVNSDHMAENSEQADGNDNESMAVTEWSNIIDDEGLRLSHVKSDWNFDAEEILAVIQKRFHHALDYVSGIPAILLSKANELSAWTAEIFNDFLSLEGLPDFTEFDIKHTFEDLLETVISMVEHVKSKANKSLKSFKETTADLAPGLNVEDIHAIQNYLDLSHVTIYLNSLMNYGLESMSELSVALAEFIQSSSERAVGHLSDIAIHLSFLLDYGLDFLLNVPNILSGFMAFVFETELVVILREEFIDPFQYFLFEIYHAYIHPIMTYVNNFRLYCGSVVSVDMPRVISKYSLKVKKCNDKSVKIIWFLSGKLSNFVQKCGNKECLLLTAQNFVQDDMFYYKLVWLILYLVLVLFLLYSTYLSNKFTMTLCWKLVLLLVKGARHLIQSIAMLSKKPWKGQLKMADSATHCALDEFEVSISQSEYNELIQASENKIQQLRKIMELERELEDTKGQNMVSFFGMYQKQGEVDALQVVSVRQDECVDNE